MRRLALIASGMLLAGCATPAAYNELKTAQAALRQHDSANFYARTQLIDGATGQAGVRRVEGCRAEFRDSLLALRNAANLMPPQDILPFVMDGAHQTDRQFDQCLRQNGLTGHMEFAIGGQMLPTPAFVRSYYYAWARFTTAQARVDLESQQNGAGIAVGLGAAAGVAAAYQPAPPTRPLFCTSQRGVGAQVTTICR